MPAALQIWVTEYLENLVFLVETKDSSSHCLMLCLFMKSGVKCKICFDKLAGFQNIGFVHC